MHAFCDICQNINALYTMTSLPCFILLEYTGYSLHIERTRIRWARTLES